MSDSLRDYEAHENSVKVWKAYVTSHIVPALEKLGYAVTEYPHSYIVHGERYTWHGVSFQLRPGGGQDKVTVYSKRAENNPKEIGEVSMHDKNAAYHISDIFIVELPVGEKPWPWDRPKGDKHRPWDAMTGSEIPYAYRFVGAAALSVLLAILLLGLKYGLIAHVVRSVMSR